MSQLFDLLCDDLSGADYLNQFNTISANILNSLAPIKSKEYKPKSEPWLNDDTRALRQVCRRAERRWKKDKLQVSYEILRDNLIQYQKVMKTAKSKYFSDLIEKNYQNQRAIFFHYKCCC